MRKAASGTLAATVAMALTGAASAQGTSTYYDFSHSQTGTYQAPGQTYIQPATTYTQSVPSYTQPATTYTQPTTTYSGSTGTTSYGQSTTTYTQPSTTYTQSSTTTAQPSTTYTQSSTTYTQPPTTTYTQPGSTGYSQIAPNYGTPTPVYSPSNPSINQGGNIYAQPLPAPPTVYSAPSFTTPAYPAAVPATTYAPGTPAAPTTNYATSSASPAGAVQDSDTWSFTLARFYPAIQACLRRSTIKNPVIANVQESGQQTMMLIGEGGSSNYSTCTTGLSGTTIKAETAARAIPPVFFAPLGSTFTVSPDRPFQPVVDTKQQVIGWIVRTQPVRVPYSQYGTAAGFDGQFIPPMMVNTAVGAS